MYLKGNRKSKHIKTTVIEQEQKNMILILIILVIVVSRFLESMSMNNIRRLDITIRGVPVARETELMDTNRRLIIM